MPLPNVRVFVPNVNASVLLQLDGCAGFLELLLELFGFVLRGAPSLTAFGAPSTSSLASFRPRPVIARTSLMTLIFLSPIAARTTSKLSFSSPPRRPLQRHRATAATATGAAAETPQRSSSSLERSAASRTVSWDSSSASFSISAMSSVSPGRRAQLDVCRSALFRGPVGAEDPGQLSARRLQHAYDLAGRCLQQADQLAAQLVQRRQGRQAP